VHGRPSWSRRYRGARRDCAPVGVGALARPTSILVALNVCVRAYVRVRACTCGRAHGKRHRQTQRKYQRTRGTARQAVPLELRDVVKNLVRLVEIKVGQGRDGGARRHAGVPAAAWLVRGTPRSRLARRSGPAALATRQYNVHSLFLFGLWRAGRPQLPGALARARQQHSRHGAQATRLRQHGPRARGAAALCLFLASERCPGPFQEHSLHCGNVSGHQLPEPCLGLLLPPSLLAHRHINTRASQGAPPWRVGSIRVRQPPSAVSPWCARG